MRKIALSVLFALVLSGMVGAGDASRCECKCVCAEEKQTKVWKTVTGDGRSASQLLSDLEAGRRRVSALALELMYSKQFNLCEKSKIYKLVLIRGDEFTDYERTTQNIFAEGARRGYLKPPAGLAAILREQFTQEELGKPQVVVMHEPIAYHADLLALLELHEAGLYRNNGGDWLHAWPGSPVYKWERKSVFVFLAPENLDSSNGSLMNHLSHKNAYFDWMAL